MPLAVAAAHTSTLELRTSIAIAFARSPMLSANCRGIFSVRRMGISRWVLIRSKGTTFGVLACRKCPSAAYA